MVWGTWVGPSTPPQVKDRLRGREERGREMREGRKRGEVRVEGRGKERSERQREGRGEGEKRRRGGERRDTLGESIDL